VCCQCTVHAATNMGSAEVFCNCNCVSEELGVLLTECVKSTHDMKPVEEIGQRKGALSDEG